MRAQRPPKPEVEPIHLRNAQRGVRLEAKKLAAFARKAWQSCDRLKGTRSWPAEPISVTLVSDRTIAAIHARFMSVPGPTDVITFQHGEIVISAETALRQAGQYRSSLEKELELYIVHGLLHLRGYDDRTVTESRQMRRLQEKIIRQIG
jgi:probable rRNA maturation factor